MRKGQRFASVALGFAVVLTAGSAVVTDVAASRDPQAEHAGGHPGPRSLGVTVSADGEALDNVPITVVNDKTNNQVFSGYTDSAGQIDVTLPQGKYTAVAQGQSKKVNLNKDQNVSFELSSDERPNG
ncbi:hypothetical protein [Halococcus agarilyticus]|uniref:hypothetical protein n=1 Tax=Halococcus agarilyticus TaxID=1232219 RepID=UPI000677F2AA|nr:hypothetical protein [Halococcus agarilyticus]